MSFFEAYSELEHLYEAKRVISDTDALYHYTNPTPFLKIFTEECLRGDVHLNAVCLTTDKNYIIYGYPCGIKLSRKSLIQDGYDLVEFDEFEDDTEAAGESEERIYGNITDVSKHVGEVYINWEHIAIVQSSTGDRIADAIYDEHGNEGESYELMLSDFLSLLETLKSKGIVVNESGYPALGEYWLDDKGTLHTGKMPELALV